MPNPLAPKRYVKPVSGGALHMAGGGAGKKAVKAILPKSAPLNAIQEMVAAANNTTRTAPENEVSDLLGRVAASAGMKPPVTAAKPLTDLQDFHTSLGDRINELAREQQDLADSMTFRYQPNQFVHSQHTLDKNLPPHRILNSMPFRQMVMREDKPFLGMKGADGKQMYHPYEPGYRVRHDISPDDWHEYQLPESALIKPVDDYNKGGAVHMAGGSLVKKAGKAILPKSAPLSGVAAPDVMTRSQITDLANRVRQSEGQFGAQRVERAADEIPNLEKLYQEQALMRAFTGDNAQGLMTMKPSDFERYAATLGLSDRSLQNISHLTNVQTSGGFSDVPYLNINKKEQGTMGLPYIAGHEGRHRNRAMDAAGEQAGLVQLVPRSELREPFPRRSREGYLEALYKEMQLTDNRVMPEAYYLDVQRPAIDLPEFYAQGGLVDSAPEEAIKNTITDPQAFRMLDMDLANLALMNQQPQRMAGGGAMKKIAKAVTKPAVLSQAEKDANLAKFLEESQFSKGYHGTTSLDEHSYEPAAITRFNDYKPVWAAKNPSLAEEYVGHDSGATYPLHISAKNPLKLNADMNNRVGSSPEVQKMLDSFGIEYDKNDTIYRHVNTSQFRDAAESMGHDSVIANERGEPTVGVFSSSQLKSTIGNKGTFDPNNEDIGHAHGGAVRMAGGGIARMAGGGLRKVATGAASHVPDFKIKDLGGLAPVQPVNLETKLGAMINVNPWDVMHRNQQIMEVSGLKVPGEVISHGGQAYARDLEHIKQQIGGASNEDIAKRVQKRFDIASREGAARGGTGEVVASPFTMGDTSVNFATPVTDLYRKFFNANATNKDFQDISDVLRDTTVKGKKPFINAPNFDDPAVDQYIKENPEFRKAFLLKMQTGKRWQELTGINPLDALAAFRDPNLLGVSPFYAGHTLIDVQPGAVLRRSNNSTYSHDFSGTYGGSIPNTPVPILLNDAFTPIAQEIRARSQAPTWKLGPVTNNQIADMSTKALGSRNENISELVTDEMIRRVEDYHKGLKSGAFPADDLALAMQYLKLPKFKDGGAVRMDKGGKASKDDIMNLKPQPKAQDTSFASVRSLLADIGSNQEEYERIAQGGAFDRRKFTPENIYAMRLLQAANATPDPARYLESLNPYHSSQLQFKLNPFTNVLGYVDPAEPNKAVIQRLEQVENTIPHELTHTLQLGRGAAVEKGGIDKLIEMSRSENLARRKTALPEEMRKSVFPSANVNNAREIWANINARAHEVNAAGGDFINSPEGRALFPTNTEQRDYYANAMPGVNSITPDTGTFVPNNQTLLQRAKKSLGFADGGGVFNPQSSDYDYQTARAHGMGQGDNGHWGSVAPASEGERKLHGLPEDSYLMLKGAQHPTWGKAVEAETARGSKIVKHGDRYYSVPSKAEGGEVSQSELDRMRFELAQAQNPTSPVMQATPRSPVQDFIGTAGGYMDQAGKFVSEAIAPTAEKHPVKHFLADLILASTLKSAGTALQDYTGTVRETDEDNPVRGVIDKGWRKLSTSTEPLLDPRALDIAGFATPVVRGATKLARVGAKAIAPFAKSTAEMAAELYTRGQMPGMVAPNAFMAEPSVPKPAKVLAPANVQGFYSPTEAAALNLQRQTGNGQAFLNDILKGENVRSEEIKAMGLDTFLKGKPNVTAAEVQGYIASNKLQLGDRTYKKESVVWGENDAGETVTENLPRQYTISNDYGKTYITDSNNITLSTPFKNEDAAKKYLEELVVTDAMLPNDVKHAQWSLPGGENYREVVLTLPSNRPSLKNMSRSEYNAAVDAADKAGVKDYQTTHWEDPNVLVHLRMSDRVTDGKKTLLVDEVQSDWHQAGRERGYKGDEIDTNGWTVERLYVTKPEEVAVYDARGEEVWAGKSKGDEAQTIAKVVEELKKKQVPQAPYKDDYYQLALRRAIKDAIDGGYDRVALPTGSRVTERFGLGNHVDRLDYHKNSDGTYGLSAIKNGREVVAREYLKQNELFDLVGKEVGEKMAKGQGKDSVPIDVGLAEEYGFDSYKSLTGLDLVVGGKGMKKYYDEIYPGYLKKFGKKYGANVGKTTVDVEGVAEPLHYMDITPAMRKEFSTGIHMAKGGKVSFADSLDAMRHELTQRQ